MEKPLHGFQILPGLVGEVDEAGLQAPLAHPDVAAVEENGEIKLSTAYDPRRGMVRLEIADNGCGLAADIRAKIFEPYFSTKENGTGLGLTIVSQIIEDHRGYIRALPNHPRGTRCTIELPASEESERQLAKNMLHS